jgi:hypothetical protein
LLPPLPVPALLLVLPAVPLEPTGAVDPLLALLEDEVLETGVDPEL